MADSPISSQFELRLPSNNSNDSVGDKLNAEAQLLMGAPAHILPGVQEKFNELKEDPVKAGMLIAEGLAIGVGVALLTKNPTALFGAGRFLAAHPRAVAAAGIGLDATMRTAPAMADTWNNPSNLEANKVRLGHNWGAAAIEYPLMGVGGVAGAMIPETASGTVAALRSVRIPQMADNMGLIPRPALAFEGNTAGGGSAAMRFDMLNDAALSRKMVADAAATRQAPKDTVAAATDGTVGGGGGEAPRPVKDILAQYGNQLQQRLLRQTAYADAEGVYLKRGDEFVAIDLGDGRVLKVGQFQHEVEGFGKRPFDAKVLDRFDIPGEGHVIVQEKLKVVEPGDVAYDNFKKAFAPGGRYHGTYEFVDPKPENLGIDSKGKVKLIDYSAVLKREQLPDGKKPAGDLDLERREDFTFAEEKEVSAGGHDNTPAVGDLSNEAMLANVMQNADANGQWVQSGWRGVKDLPEVQNLIASGVKQKKIEAALRNVWGDPL